MPLANKADHQVRGYDLDVNASHYDRDEGLLAIPVMGPAGTPPKVVRVHAAIGYRRVNWAYNKRGAPPIMPSMSNTTDNNDIFLGGDLSLPVPALGGDQNQLDYVATGEYTYVQNVSGSGCRLAQYDPAQGKIGITPSPMGKFQTGHHPYYTPALSAAILAGATPGFLAAPGALFSLPDWPDPTQSQSADAQSIDFSKSDYKYYDYTISSLFFSDSLIL